MSVRLQTGEASLVFDPAGGRIRSLRVGDVDLLLPVVDDLVGGSYPMAPYAGRIRRGRLTFEGAVHELPVTLSPHAIHGSVRHHRWTPDGDSWVTPLGPGWPFRGECRQRMVLDPTRLRLDLVVVAGERMPVSLGWHPWFRRGTLRVRPSRMYQRDVDGVPTGVLVEPPPGPWDDCFVLDGAPEIEIEGLRVRLESDAPVWVVYDERPDTICVEPQTAAPDAANLGCATILGPGERLSMALELVWG